MSPLVLHLLAAVVDVVMIELRFLRLAGLGLALLLAADVLARKAAGR